MEEFNNSPEPLISFRDADIMNTESAVIYGLNLNVYRGDMVYIVGKVGTGKTSIIRTLIAENKLGKGSCRICGYEVNGIKDRDIPYLRRKVGVVFQDFQLLMDRSVEENLEFVLKATGWKDRELAGKRIQEVLESVGMTHKAHKMPHQLSGGEQQRIAIARSLLNEPEVILADEPTGNLDSKNSSEVIALLHEASKKYAQTIIMITHSQSIAQTADRVLKVSDGVLTDLGRCQA